MGAKADTDLNTATCRCNYSGFEFFGMRIHYESCLSKLVKPIKTALKIICFKFTDLQNSLMVYCDYQGS